MILDEVVTALGTKHLSGTQSRGRGGDVTPSSVSWTVDRGISKCTSTMSGVNRIGWALTFLHFWKKLQHTTSSCPIDSDWTRTHTLLL